MISKIGLAVRAYRKWANVAIWDPTQNTEDSFATKIEEICEHYGISDFELLAAIDVLSNRGIDRWFQE